MNKQNQQNGSELLSYQTSRLKALIEEINKCCDQRKLYETERFGIPNSELKCLMLFKNERYLTVKVIAQKLEVAKSRVTKIVDGLIRKGLIDRTEDPNDARIKLLNLTPEGNRLMEEIDQFYLTIHGQILLQMHPEERKDAIMNLEMVRSAMEAVKESLV